MDSGFERPCLGCHPCSDNLPLVLSDDSESPPIQVPASMAKYLRDYQREGVRFLFGRYRAEGGGILADEMGLGKTIQAIAFMAAILKMNGTKLDELRHVTNFIRQDVDPNFAVPCFDPVLIICPASLSDNWKQEILTWGYFKVLKFNSKNSMETINKARDKSCDILITTYGEARVHTHLLNSVQWSAVIVDEVHRIKDKNSKTTKALCSISNKRRFGLTGTPFQNNLKEMCCILDWANPGSMSKQAGFNNSITKNIEYGVRQQSTKRECASSELAFIQFKSYTRKYVLQRKKNILKNYLPKKTDQVVFCELSEAQENIYHALVQSPEVQSLLGQLKEGSCNSNGWFSKSSATQSSKEKAGLLFTYLHLLQKAANHPALLMSSTATASADIAFNICRNALGDNVLSRNNNCKKKLAEALASIEMSGKMQVLFELVEAFLKRGDKLLIFSHSTRLLDLIQKQIIQKRFKFSRLDGSTPTDTRYNLVRAFNTSPQPSIFLISTRAGGVGLNITGANVVIIYDPNWNPAHDMQAQDRAYRLGQQRDVRVYRLLSTATIEEFIYLRQLYKQQLGLKSVSGISGARYFNSVPGDRKYYGELFGIHNIFSFRQNKKSLTEEILERQQTIDTKLKLNMKLPVMDTMSGAKVQPFPEMEFKPLENKGFELVENKSGLSGLCEDIVGLPEEDYVRNDSSDSENEHDEIDDVDSGEEAGPGEDSIANILETTAAVKTIFQHDEIVAPSRAEEFMTDCALRDVLQKQRNSQLPAFECSSGSLETSMLPQPEDQSMLPIEHVQIVRRIKFASFAKKEYLTPYELGLKVLSMSPLEKLRFLNKHQTKKLYIHTSSRSSRDVDTARKEDPLLPSKCSLKHSSSDGKAHILDPVNPRKRTFSLDESRGTDDEKLHVKVARNEFVKENSLLRETDDLMMATINSKQILPSKKTSLPFSLSVGVGCLPQHSLEILNSLFFSDFKRRPSPCKTMHSSLTLPPKINYSARKVKEQNNCTQNSAFVLPQSDTSSLVKAEETQQNDMSNLSTIQSLNNDEANRFKRKMYSSPVQQSSLYPTYHQRDVNENSSSFVVKELINELFFGGCSRDKTADTVVPSSVFPVSSSSSTELNDQKSYVDKLQSVPKTSSCVQEIMDELFFNGSSDEVGRQSQLERHVSVEYKIEDDIFRNLLKTGKLKHV